MAEVDLMHLDCFVDQRRESSSILIAGPDRFSQEKEVGLKVQEEEATLHHKRRDLAIKVL